MAAHNSFATKFIRAGALAFRFRDDDSIEQFHARLSRMRWRGQIVGPHGSGKSTLLRTLDGYWESWNREPVTFTLRNRQRFLPDPSRAARWNGRTQVIIDGYEQLCWMARAWLRMRCRKTRCGLLVTTHRGMTLPTILQTTTSLPLANELVDELLANNSSGKLNAQDIETCFVKAKGNLRETFLSLYDLYRDG